MDTPATAGRTKPISLAVTATAMRQIRIDHAGAQAAEKRSAGLVTSGKVDERTDRRLCRHAA